MGKISTLVSLFLIISTFKGYAQFFPVDTARLNTAYKELARDTHSLEKQKAFFDAFPSTFDDFFMTYQYIKATGYDLSMYYKGADHIITNFKKARGKISQGGSRYGSCLSGILREGLELIISLIAVT
jgi:hypothetical protein